MPPLASNEDGMLADAILKRIDNLQPAELKIDTPKFLDLDKKKVAEEEKGKSV